MRFKIVTSDTRSGNGTSEILNQELREVENFLTGITDARDYPHFEIIGMGDDKANGFRFVANTIHDRHDHYIIRAYKRHNEYINEVVELSELYDWFKEAERRFERVLLGGKRRKTIRRKSIRRRKQTRRRR